MCPSVPARVEIRLGMSLEGSLPSPDSSSFLLLPGISVLPVDPSASQILIETHKHFVVWPPWFHELITKEEFVLAGYTDPHSPLSAFGQTNVS